MGTAKYIYVKKSKGCPIHKNKKQMQPPVEIEGYEYLSKNLTQLNRDLTQTDYVNDIKMLL